MRTGHLIAIVGLLVASFSCGGGGKATNSAAERPSSGGDEGAPTIPEDPIAAACDNGIAKSCLSAASSTDDPLEARELYDKGCELGEALGCLYAGQLWVEAEPTDRARALVLFDRGCELKEAAACYGGGLVASGLFGGGAEPKIAAEFQRRGCNQNLADACTSLGMMLLAGEGVEKNVERGIELLEASCEADEGGACIALGGRAAEDGDEARALELYRSACDAGDGQGCTLLASGVEDSAEQQRLYEEGCMADVPDPTACTYAALSRYEGEQPEAAVAVFRQTCESGDAMGCFLLAVAYANGRGVEPSPSQSDAFLEQACRADPARCESFRDELNKRTEK